MIKYPYFYPIIDIVTGILSCGNLGKVENRQVGVFSAYASKHGYALLDKRLFMPEKWFDDDYAIKREKCKVPKGNHSAPPLYK